MNHGIRKYKLLLDTFDVIHLLLFLSETIRVYSFLAFQGFTLSPFHFFIFFFSKSFHVVSQKNRLSANMDFRYAIQRKFNFEFSIREFLIIFLGIALNVGIEGELGDGSSFGLYQTAIHRLMQSTRDTGGRYDTQ